MKPEVCMWSSYYIDLSPEDAVLELEKYGYHLSEFSDEHGQMLLDRGGDEKEIGKSFKQFALNHGISFPQGHLWLYIQLVTGTDVIPQLKRWINLYEAMGIKKMVLHMDSIDNQDKLTTEEVLDKNIGVLQGIKPFLEGKDITICLENLLSKHLYHVDELNYVLDRLNDDEHFGITLDTGHLNIAKNLHHDPITQRDFVLKAGRRLKALHIADNEGATDQHMMPFGKGNVNFAEVFNALKEINYEYAFNYEIPGERKAPLEIRGMKLEYIKKCFGYMIDHYFENR